MKVLVIGGGGREHAIVWKLSQSRHVDKIYCCPGNAGISEIADCIDVRPEEFDALIDFVKYDWIDLTIVASEELLSKGIVDAFEKEGCKILGPHKAAAQFCSSKIFAKNLLKLYQIPTAEYKVFSSYLHAEDYVRLKGAPIIIKTDESAVENSIFVASTVEEAINAIRLIMKDQVFGEAGKRVIVEDNLNGEEVSMMVFTDGQTIIPLTNIRPYKRILNGNRGQNTKGMGAYSPAPVMTDEVEATIMQKIIKPTIKAFNSEGIQYKGILSISTMIDKGIPYVLTLDCSFGDPETQTILPRLKTDFMDIALATIEGRLYEIDIEWEKEISVCVVVSSQGYPSKYEKGVIIKGLDKVKTMRDVFVFHSGTSFHNNEIVTADGRVLSITATGTDVIDARTKAYNAVEKIHFEGMYCRTDIGDNQ